MTLSTQHANSPRDRHGRGIRGILLPWNLPGYKTRLDSFNNLVIQVTTEISRRLGDKIRDLSDLEIATEDVPASDPAPWEENTVALSRSFPADKSNFLAPRIILYRRPIEARSNKSDRAKLIQQILLSEIANLLHCLPEDLLE